MDGNETTANAEAAANTEAAANSEAADNAEATGDASSSANIGALTEGSAEAAALNVKVALAASTLSWPSSVAC